MGKDEKRAPLKTPAWEAIFGDAGIAGIAVIANSTNNISYLVEA